METGRYERYNTDEGESIHLFPDPTVDPPVDLSTELRTFEDAKYPFPNWDRNYNTIKYITIHHSSGSRATQNIRWWHHYHTVSKSWSRAGYHYGIAALNQGDPIGLYEINPPSTLSWHDSRNTDTVGVCFAGRLQEGYDIRPNEIQLDLWGRLCAWLLPQLPNVKQIVGHFRWGSTACPGDLHVWYPDLIEAAGNYDVDISEMISLDTRTSISTIRALAFGRLPKWPPPTDYDESFGIGRIMN